MSAGPSCRIRAGAVGLGDAVLGGRAAEATRPCHAEQQVTARQVRYTRRQRWGGRAGHGETVPGLFGAGGRDRARADPCARRHPRTATAAIAALTTTS